MQSPSIAELNDAFRQSFHGGRVFTTSGISEKGLLFESLAIEAVQEFSNFTADNDPYEEHDFGSVRIDDTKVWWKIDYYDKETKYGSPDPADPEQTTRILTIYLPDEH